MEFWDIYDENKQLTGRMMKRNDWCLKDGEYHLTVLGVIARPDGTFLITKRVMTKAWAPGWWEVSGGGVQAGESSEEAVQREVKEETGLDVRNAEGGYLFTYKRENPDEGDNYFVDVYRFVMDIDENDVSFQEAEIDGYMFLRILYNTRKAEFYDIGGKYLYDGNDLIRAVVRKEEKKLERSVMGFRIGMDENSFIKVWHDDEMAKEINRVKVCKVLRLGLDKKRESGK